MKGLFHDFTTLNSNTLMDMSIPLCVALDAKIVVAAQNKDVTQMVTMKIHSNPTKRWRSCRELTRNSQTCEKQNRENTCKKKSNHTHKTVFMWFDNLPTFTELQGFHYYQEKNISAAVQCFNISKQQQPKP